MALGLRVLVVGDEGGRLVSPRYYWRGETRLVHVKSVDPHRLPEAPVLEGGGADGGAGLRPEGVGSPRGLLRERRPPPTLLPMREGFRKGRGRRFYTACGRKGGRPPGFFGGGSVKRALFLAAFLTLVGTSALAQPLQVYYADDLERQPGVIHVTKGFNTVIQLYDRFDSYTVTKGEVVQVQELDPSTLWLYTAQSQGITGMTVMVGGRVLQFTIVVRPGDYNRTYRVEPSRTVYGPVAPAQSAPASSASERAPATSSAPSRPVPPPPSVEMSFALTSLQGRAAVVSFTAKNLGREDIYLDVARLRITQGGAPVVYSISRTPARVRVSPGETQSGTLTLKLSSTTAPVLIEWTVTTPSGQQTHIRYPVPLDGK